ncbi:hypothetical protein DS745_20550 [Anaerobacillus alkaliphilus]|uniref:IDEAL domain-containing protein n=1 Tax=Anaerobacillus alkaliphilus TaxID=1548597 RepID=A0A4Q0VL50_9BACI|nr:hypothetical protein [Anaerobacillus alkaliphilus]RXI96138.1 hypothetical protein DS745_20550 [Anaerobacillus alkaliphilus]
MFSTNPELKVGEWVKGKTENDELIKGYIVSIDQFNGIVKITVVESDHIKLIGKYVVLLKKNVTLLPVVHIWTEGFVRDLIDVALLTNDSEWFKELVQKLPSSIKDTTNDRTNSFLTKNRLNSYK